MLKDNQDSNMQFSIRLFPDTRSLLCNIPIISYPESSYYCYRPCSSPMTPVLTVVWPRLVRYRRSRRYRPSLQTRRSRDFPFLILSSRFAMLARKMTDADGTRRQSNLLKRNFDRSIVAEILSTDRSSGQYFPRQISERDLGKDRGDIFCKHRRLFLLPNRPN
jgi:hypothetical protein